MLRPLRILQPHMLQQLVGVPSLLRVFLKTVVQEVTEVFRPLSFIDFWWWVVCDIVQHSDLLLTNVGRLTLGQLHNEDAERPHVNFVVILHLAADHFWSDPANSAHFGNPIFCLCCQLGCVSKVGQLDATF